MTPKGGIVPHNKFSVKSSKSEILFVDYIANHLTSQGKAGIIVPDGVVFSQDKSFVNVRKDLIENSLWGVISLSSGIFQPYASVSTNILLLDKKIAKTRDSIVFAEINNDGYSMSKQRKKIDGNEIPKITSSILKYKNQNIIDENIFAINKQDIIENNCDLSINKYKKDEIENVDYGSPSELYSEIKNIESKINEKIIQLEDLLCQNQ